MPKMTKYYAPKEGEWVTVARIHRHACCDCGLVHVIEVRKRGQSFQMRGWRSGRRTGGKRAALKRKREGVFG